MTFSYILQSSQNTCYKTVVAVMIMKVGKEKRKNVNRSKCSTTLGPKQICLLYYNLHEHYATLLDIVVSFSWDQTEH